MAKESKRTYSKKFSLGVHDADGDRAMSFSPGTRKIAPLHRSLQQLLHNYGALFDTLQQKIQRWKAADATKSRKRAAEDPEHPPPAKLQRLLYFERKGQVRSSSAAPSQATAPQVTREPADTSAAKVPRELYVALQGKIAAAERISRTLQ